MQEADSAGVPVGLATRETKCPRCGARIEIGPNVLRIVCAACGANIEPTSAPGIVQR